MPRIVVRLLSGIGALVAVAVVCGSAFASAAQAANATWSGADSSASWSSGLNWVGGTAPGSSIGTLTFPDLGTTCDDAAVGIGPGTSETCYTVNDDAGAVDVSQIVVDGAAGYWIVPSGAGGEIQLAGTPTDVGGMTENVGLIDAFGAFGPNGPFCCTEIGVPVALSADQVWELDGGTDQSQLQTEVDEISGSSSTLGLDFSNGANLTTTSLDTGATTLSGDGSLYVEPEENSTLDAVPTLPSAGVTVTNGATLDVGAPDTPSGPLTVPPGNAATVALTTADPGGQSALNGTLNVTGNVSLSSATNLDMGIYEPAGGGSTPAPSLNYAQITATGSVSLGNAEVDVDQSGFAPCFDLVPGQVYTLISAAHVTGALDYNGSQILNGQTITVSDASQCQINPGYDATVAINYTSDSVTATVVSGGHAGDTPIPGQATIIGTPLVGSPLTVVNSGWTGDPTSYDYQWQSCSDDGSDCTTVGTDSPQYTPTLSDVGKVIDVSVTAANVYGSEAELYSPATAETTAEVPLPPAPTNTSAPAISGTATVGDALIASPGSWNGSPTIAYQWERCTSQAATSCADIQGATSSSYTLTSADIGQYLRATVTGTNLGGSKVAYTPTSAVVDAARSQSTTTAPSSTLPDASQVQAALNILTRPAGSKEVADLLKAGSFKTSFKAPSAGTFQVVWTTSVTTGNGKKKKHKSITIATGNSQPGAAAKITITIHLTRTGKALLNQKHARVSLTATEKFKPNGGNWSSVTKKFSI